MKHQTFGGCFQYKLSQPSLGLPGTLDQRDAQGDPRRRAGPHPRPLDRQRRHADGGKGARDQGPRRRTSCWPPRGRVSARVTTRSSRQPWLVTGSRKLDSALRVELEELMGSTT